MKNIINFIWFSHFCLLIMGNCQAQGSITTSFGAKMVIDNGSYLVLMGGLTNTGSNTEVTNNGTLISQGGLQNMNNATLKGNGNYKFGGLWNNNAFFLAGTSTVELSSNTIATINSGNYPFYNLTLNKGSKNSIVSLSSNPTIVTNVLTFKGANNKLQLDIFNLTVGMPIIGFDETKYIITNDIGKLIASMVSATAFTFPVGSSSTSYTPLSISQAGMALSLGLVVKDQVLISDAMNNVLSSNVVNKSWVVTEEGVPVTKNLTLTPQWNSSDQATDFDPIKCGISRWNTTTSSWDLANTNAVGGTNPHSRTRSNNTSVGTFAIRSKELTNYFQDNFSYPQKKKMTNKSSKSLKVYPNPVRDELTVIGGSQEEFMITDLLGRVILRGVLSDNQTYIDVTSMSSGLYLLQTKDMVDKFFKE